MRCDEIGSLAREEADRGGCHSLVDILQRKGDSAREDKTRATTSYWPGSARTQWGCSMQLRADRLGGGAALGHMQDLRPRGLLAYHSSTVLGELFLFKSMSTVLLLQVNESAECVF